MRLYRTSPCAVRLAAEGSASSIPWGPVDRLSATTVSHRGPSATPTTSRLETERQSHCTNSQGHPQGAPRQRSSPAFVFPLSGEIQPVSSRLDVWSFPYQ